MLRSKRSQMFVAPNPQFISSTVAMVFFKDERETKKNTIVLSTSAKERKINGATFYPILNVFLLNLQYCLTSSLRSVA